MADGGGGGRRTHTHMDPFVDLLSWRIRSASCVNICRAKWLVAYLLSCPPASSKSTITTTTADVNQTVAHATQKGLQFVCVRVHFTYNQRVHVRLITMYRLSALEFNGNRFASSLHFESGGICSRRSEGTRFRSFSTLFALG